MIGCLARLTPDRLVLILGLLGGLPLVFATPPFQVPDEPAHFLHVYQIATAAGAVRGPAGVAGFEMPASLPRLAELCVAGVPFHPGRRLPAGLLAAAWRLPLAPERRAFVPAGLLNPYTPGPYLAAAAAVGVGRLLELRPLALLYVARLANLAAALAVAWAAVRLAPVYGWLFALLALTPMAMFERSSASADALTDALGLLLVSCILSLAVAPQRSAAARAAAHASRAECAPHVVALPLVAPALEVAPAMAAARLDAPVTPVDADSARRAVPLAGRAAWLLAAAVLLAAAKAVYFLLDLLIFLVPASRIPLGRRSRLGAVTLWSGGLAAIAAGLGFSWWQARLYFSVGWLQPGVQPAAQLQGVIAAPQRFLDLALADYAHHALRYGAELVGNFGWLDTPLPRLAIVVWALALLAAALTGGSPELELAGWQRCLIAAVVAAALLGLSFSQYVAWTPLGAGFIEGLQGRYFLPLAPAAALLLYNRRLAGRWPAGPGAGLRFGVLSLAFTILTLLRIWFRYHGH